MWLVDAQATEAAGELLGNAITAGDVVALSGSLGAGKTCFARGLIHSLGFEGDVPSPTFPIVIPYAPPDVRVSVWHVDLYRIDSQHDVEELGLDDARIDAALIIEWPERLGTELWTDALHIHLSVDGSGRRLTGKVPTAWETRWPFR